MLNMNVFDSLMVEEIMLSNCSIATFIALEFIVFVMMYCFMIFQWVFSIGYVITGVTRIRIFIVSMNSFPVTTKWSCITKSFLTFDTFCFQIYFIHIMSIPCMLPQISYFVRAELTNPSAQRQFIKCCNLVKFCSVMNHWIFISYINTHSALNLRILLECTILSFLGCYCI